MVNVFLVRHTAVQLPPGHCYGWLDVEPAAGLAQAALEIGARLPLRTARAVVSSPLVRCRRLAERWSSAPILDEDLRELHFGAWEGKAWDAIDPEELARWGRDFVDVPAGGGESFRELQRRSVSALRRMRDLGGDVVCVTHAGVIRALLCHASGIPLVEAFATPVAHGEVFRLTARDADADCFRVTRL